jgi:cytochrome c-type biogenesis protein CcmF
MIAEGGRIALITGTCLAGLTALLWLRAALAGDGADAQTLKRARSATRLTLVCAAAAAGLLELALLTHDFGVGYVADTGGRHVPLYYTITSLWAAQDGSLLLWLVILAGYAAIAGRPATAPRALHAYAMTVIGVVMTLFFALSLFAANPFTLVAPAADGPGPNPLLRENPAMGLHPPLLYAGYVGTVIPFAYAVAALLRSEGDGWLRACRRSLLASWCLLTAGIALGAWWSYATLGWGGYWAWDPVENASLLPWLTTTALLHSSLVQQRRRALTGLSVALAAGGFLFALIGTFLTRSGAVSSVHSFARSPLGPLLLGFAVIAIVAFVGIGLVRGDRLPVGRGGSAFVSRESALAANAVLLIAMAAIVFTGTLFPLLSQALGGVRQTIGAAYFNRSAVPVALLLVALTGVGPLIRWRRDAARRVGGRLLTPAALALIAVAVTGAASRATTMVVVAIGVAVYAMSATAPSLLERLRPASRGKRTPIGRGLRRPLAGGVTAHLGVGVLTVGIAVSSGFANASENEMAAGQTVRAAGVTLALDTLQRVSNPEGESVVAAVRVSARTGHREARPALRYFTAHDVTVSRPAILPGWSGDTYVTLLRADDVSGTVTVRVARIPMVWLVWLGAVLIIAGGVLAGRRRRSPPVPPLATRTAADMARTR